MERSETIGALASALAKAQATFKAVPKTKTARIRTKSGAEYSYTYADLAVVWDTCRTALAENKLSIVQLPEDAGDGRIGVTTMLCHESGEWISGFLGMRIADASRTGETSPQALGMAVTYLRRYGLASLIGLVTEEDTDAQPHDEQRQTEQQQSETKASVERKPAPPPQPAPKSPDRAQLLHRLYVLLEEADSLGMKDLLPKPQEQMTNYELLKFGKLLRQRVDEAKATTGA